MLKPILKYKGGKYKEIKYFLKYLPLDYSTYIEPFFGGGALFFYLEPNNAIINDINNKLIWFYNDVKNNFDLLNEQINNLCNIYKINQLEYLELKKLNNNVRVSNKNEILYYTIRKYFNDNTLVSPYIFGTLYYFINKLSYSNMIRYNKKNQYNVPYGFYNNLKNSLDVKHSLVLNRTKIYSLDYTNIIKKANDTDFIFLDPPYDCVFNDYGVKSFNCNEQEKLADEFKKIKCKALMIINKTDLTYSLYKDYICDEYQKNYAVNIKNRFKNSGIHLIIKNY